MDVIDLLETIESGEDSQTQFKEIFTSSDALAAEISAFANSQGGKIIVGVKDNGEIIGLEKDELKSLNLMVSNVCSQKIEPPITVTTENIKYKDKIVVVITVPKGPNKFYIANGRDIWVKVGADKRKASRDELRRLLQESFNMFADEQRIEGTNIESLEMGLVEEFIQNRTGEGIENLPKSAIETLLHNMKIISGGQCTLAGLLLFGKKENQVLAQYKISAVSWYGNDLAGTEYGDSEDIRGNALVLYKEGMAFLKRQLRKVQRGQNFNSLGVLEVPEIALQEALINAIVHRDYYIQSNIRLFVFDNRVEIISPGVLPNTLTVETIKSGVHVARNPIILSHIKDIKGIPYRGIGTGVARIIKSCSEASVAVDFYNEIEKNQFKVVFERDKTS